MPLSALAADTCLAIASCAVHWMSRSIVSVTSMPGTASTPDESAVGISVPRAELWKRLRSRRARELLVEAVLEAAETPWPSAPTKPTTFAATEPAG